MRNNLTTTNQDAKLALIKSKNLIDITNKLLANRPSKELIESFENFRFLLNFGHTSIVTSIAITPDGKNIVSGSWDGTIKLWNNVSFSLHVTFVFFYDNEWLAWKPNGEYNCSDGAYKYFCFMDDSKGLPSVVDVSHPIYKAKKKEKLLSDYTVGEKVKAPIDNTTIIEPSPYDDIPDIDIYDDEIPF